MPALKTMTEHAALLTRCPDLRLSRQPGARAAQVPPSAECTLSRVFAPMLEHCPQTGVSPCPGLAGSMPSGGRGGRLLEGGGPTAGLVCGCAGCSRSPSSRL